MVLSNILRTFVQSKKEEMDQKAHWENVYSTKQPNEVSWTQEKPYHSLELIAGTGMDKSAKIIDIGGGDSNLVDFLLDAGYENITVLDISENAIKRAKKRLGENALKVTWIVSDVVEFQPSETYDIWHDRAAFHFLTSPEQIRKYVSIVSQAVKGSLVLGTFSDEGPLKCSGLEISQYTADKIRDTFGATFKLVESFKDNHTTPFNTTQNFLYCRLVKQ